MRAWLPLSRQRIFDDEAGNRQKTGVMRPDSRGAAVERGEGDLEIEYARSGNTSLLGVGQEAGEAVDAG